MPINFLPTESLKYLLETLRLIRELETLHHKVSARKQAETPRHSEEDEETPHEEGEETFYEEGEETPQEEPSQEGDDRIPDEEHDDTPAEVGESELSNASTNSFDASREKILLEELRIKVVERIKRALKFPLENRAVGSVAIDNAIAASSAEAANLNSNWKRFQDYMRQRRDEISRRNREIRRLRMRRFPQGESARISVLGSPILGRNESIMDRFPDERIVLPDTQSPLAGAGHAHSNDGNLPVLASDLSVQDANETLGEEGLQRIRNDTRRQIEVQMGLSNLIKFCISAEQAIKGFLRVDSIASLNGVEFKSPTTEKHGQKEETISEKADRNRSRRTVSALSLLEVYRVRQRPPTVIPYKQDFSKGAAIVPHASVIARHNPTYFIPDGITSIVGADSKPLFGDLDLSDMEIIVLAYAEQGSNMSIRTEGDLETDPANGIQTANTNEINQRLFGQREVTTLVQRRRGISFEDEFKKVVAVLYHLKKEIRRGSYGQGAMSPSERRISITSLLRSMIADLSIEVDVAFKAGQLRNQEGL
jgi:hypothetical protein